MSTFITIYSTVLASIVGGTLFLAINKPDEYLEINGAFSKICFWIFLLFVGMAYGIIGSTGFHLDSNNQIIIGIILLTAAFLGLMFPIVALEIAIPIKNKHNKDK